MGNIIKVDFSGRWSQSLDQLMERHIKEETFPGIEILFAQGPEILLHKTWGRQEAGSDKPMGLNTVFDIASLTKPVATTSLIMLLQEQGMLDLEEPVATFLPGFGNGATPPKAQGQYPFASVKSKETTPFEPITQELYTLP